MSKFIEDEQFVSFITKHEKQLKGMMKRVKLDSLKDEKKLKQTLKMLAMLGNVPVTEEKLDQVVELLKKHQFDPNDPNSLTRIISSMKKNKNT